MKNLSLNDSTQLAILPHISITEELLCSAIKSASGTGGEVEIVAMPDLGLSSNVIRMRGGFFTGMYIHWKCNLPFVPVDATVNSCGVYIFTLNQSIERADFERRIQMGKKNIHSLNYNWNFERGNHFITYGHFNNGTPCIVMHASADEYKKSRNDVALYPTNDCWYKDEIRVYYSQKEEGGRYLRYICGNAAEKFIGIAMSINEKNGKRHKDIAQIMFGDILNDEYLFVSHYGMPTSSSIAIGCSWEESRIVLLSAAKKSIYIIKPDTEHDAVDANVDGLSLNPHGFGVEIQQPVINYKNGNLHINGVIITSDDSISYLNGRGVRMRNATDKEVDEHVTKILAECKGTIQNVIKPTLSLSSVGLI